MGNLKFSPSVSYESSVLVPVSAYSGLRVPQGVPAYGPISVPFSRMTQLAPNKFPAPAGLTVPTKMSVTLKGNWTQTGKSPVQWQFQSGELELAVTIAVYIIDKYAPLDDLFAMIMSHEYLHVKDEIEVATQFLPQELPKDEWVKKYLIDQALVDNATYCNWFTGDLFKKYILDTWVEERNRLGRGRDSGAAYERYKQEVAKLLPKI
jgi:hypothetical protein